MHSTSKRRHPLRYPSQEHCFKSYRVLTWVKRLLQSNGHRGLRESGNDVVRKGRLKPRALTRNSRMCRRTKPPWSSNPRLKLRMIHHGRYVDRPRNHPGRQGQHHRKGGALAKAAVDLDSPVVCVHYMSDDREPQTRTCCAAADALGNAVELIEDASLLVRRDTYTGVRDGNGHRFVSMPSPELC